MRYMILVIAALALLLAGAGPIMADTIGVVAISQSATDAGPAGVDPYFLLTFQSGDGLNGSVILNTIDNGNGSFRVTGGSGSVSAPGFGLSTLTLIGYSNGVNTSPLGAFNYDNQLFPTLNPFLNIWGLLFSRSDGMEANLWGNSPGSYSYYEGIGAGVYPYANDNVTAQLSAVPESGIPEPATLTLLGLGLCGIGLLKSRTKA